jgi:GntR family transcriptional regulator
MSKLSTGRDPTKMTSHTSTSQKLHENLGNLIASKKPGERLPSEPALAKQLGVSRATLREAMRTFETQGHIRRRQGAGTYVNHPSTVIESGLEILESIETMARRSGLQVAMGELMVDRRAATDDEISSMGLPPGSDITQITRVMHAEGRPVAYLIDLVPVDILAPQDLTGDFTGSVLDLLLQRGDPELISSRCDINAVTASHQVARALGIQRGDVLVWFGAILYNSTGRVVDTSFSYFLPGYFRFHVVRRIGDVNSSHTWTGSNEPGPA